MKTDDLSFLDDDFNNTSTLSNWQTHHQTENWPSFTQKAEIRENESIFHLEPTTSAWYGEFHRSPYYFKMVKGNFTIITRLNVSGLNSLSPTKGFSLAGIMLRSPRPSGIAKNKKGHENWMFLSTGSATKKGEPQFESKNTVKGKSKLKVFPSKHGWIYLSISRIGDTFCQCYRYENNSKWILLRIIKRTDMTDELQAGMLAYSGFWNLMKWYFNPFKFNTKETINKADLIARFDYTIFRRIDEHSTNEALSEGYYNQSLPMGLTKQLKLEN